MRPVRQIIIAVNSEINLFTKGFYFNSKVCGFSDGIKHYGF